MVKGGRAKFSRVEGVFSGAVVIGVRRIFFQRASGDLSFEDRAMNFSLVLPCDLDMGGSAGMWRESWFFFVDVLFGVMHRV